MHWRYNADQFNGMCTLNNLGFISLNKLAFEGRCKMYGGLIHGFSRHGLTTVLAPSLCLDSTIHVIYPTYTLHTNNNNHKYSHGY